jgi:hypothetical protein
VQQKREKPFDSPISSDFWQEPGYSGLPPLRKPFVTERSQWRDAVLDCIPSNFGIEHLITMHYVAAHPINALPLNFRVTLLEFLAQTIHCFTNLDEAKRAAILKDCVGIKRFEFAPKSLERLFKSAAIAQDEA